MSDQQPRYKWPRYVLAGVVIFVVATLIWMTIEVYKIKQERNPNTPMQTQ